MSEGGRCCEKSTTVARRLVSDLSNYNRARMFAFEMARRHLHNKTDKAGNPLWHHGCKMEEAALHDKSLGCTDFIEFEEIVILCSIHDLLEDTDLTIYQIAAELGIMVNRRYPNLMDNLLAVSRKEGEDYFAYIHRAGSYSFVSRTVKRLDVEHHLTDTSSISESLIARYKKAHNFLKGPWKGAVTPKSTKETDGGGALGLGRA